MYGMDIYGQMYGYMDIYGHIYPYILNFRIQIIYDNPYMYIYGSYMIIFSWVVLHFMTQNQYTDTMAFLPVNIKCAKGKNSIWS